ncbi:histidine protein methyltransferase 1 homolog isoform X2 [Cephus cinctus]|nr:histidine protein methyltransferase 1 homolog isoform X2 [Cephus cinctus]
MENNFFNNIPLKLVHTDKVMIDLKNERCENIIEAESQHSDLVPAKYEGGLKIWECSYDLGEFLLKEKIRLKDKTVLDLGCGAGIIGLIALHEGSTVHFQDYNTEVLKAVTIPNVILNLTDRNSIRNRCEFYCGDWKSFAELSSNKYDSEDKKYDFIFTSETIYNPDNQKKLYEVFKKQLKKDGVGYVAAKMYYFGVGGSIGQFENIVKNDGIFNSIIVWKSKEGVQRAILKLTRKDTT